MNSQKKKIVIAAIILIAVCVGGFFIYKGMKPEATEGAKKIEITVVHGDGEEKDFTYRTDEKYLAEVLLENELVNGDSGEYGLFIKTVDDETADDAKQEWWCITKDGENVNTGVSETPIANGDDFEITLKTGY